MQKYTNNVQTINGKAIEGASVTVTDLSGNVATIYSDNGVTTRLNPVVTDALGSFYFYAADGRYSLSILANGVITTVTDILLEDPQDGSSVVFSDITADSIVLDGVDLSGSAGSSAIGFIQAGIGAVLRMLQSKVRESISVKDYGATGDGVTNDTAGLLACVEANPGRRIFMPKGIYCIDETFWNKYDGTIIEGETVGAYTFNQTDGTYGTTIKWIGASGGVAVQMSRFEHTTNPYSLSGGGFKNIRIDGNNLAGTCFYTPDMNNCIIDMVKIDNPLLAGGKGWDLTGFVPDVGGLNSVYNCKVGTVMITVDGTADGIYMGSTPNVGGGDHPAFVNFDNIHVTYKDGIAINIYEADDCHFDTVGISRKAGGTGDAIVLQGSQVDGNFFTNINVTATDGTAPRIWARSGSRANYFMLAGVDKQVKPTIEAGAECFYLYTGDNVTANNAEFASPFIKLPNVDSPNANHLDWYEEGFITPVLNFGGATTGITYSQQFGRYTRIGRIVFCSFAFTLTSKGSATGNATVTGLPFTPAASNTSFSMIRPAGGFTGVGGGVGLNIGTSASGTFLTNAATGMTTLTDANFGNTAQVVATFSYEA
jgi:hypothetical protein